MRINPGPTFLLFFLLWTFVLTDVYGSRDTTGVLQRFKLHLQSRFSFVDHSTLAFWAGSLGYTWGPYEREITLGYHWLGPRGTSQWTRIERQRALTTLQPIYPRVEAGFVNLGYWHILHNSRRWKAGVPLEIGLGTARKDYYLLALDRPLLLAVPEVSRIMPVQVGAYGEWKATRWVGVGLQGGYRYNMMHSGELALLDGMFYRLRVLVYPAAFSEGFNFVFRRKPLPSPFFKDS